MLFILAGTVQEAADAARRRGLGYYDWTYVRDYLVICAAEDPDYIIVGTFWERADREVLLEWLWLRMRSGPKGPRPREEVAL